MQGVKTTTSNTGLL